MISAIHERDSIWSVEDDGVQIMRIAAPAGADAAAVMALYAEMVSPAATVEAARAEMLAALAARRWQAETSGIVIAGATIMTDAASQAKLTGAAVAAMRDPDMPPLRWKCRDGSFVALSPAQILAIADAVRSHVQACFDREATLAGEICAASQADLATIDINAGWPATDA